MDHSKLTTAEIFPAFIAKVQELFNYLIFDFNYEIKSENYNGNTATIIYTNDVIALAKRR